MLQKKKYITPTTRFASIIPVVDNSKLSFKNFYKRKPQLNKKRKVFSQTKQITPVDSFRVNYAGVVMNYGYNKKPYKLMVSIKSIYNHTIIWPGMEAALPGRPVFDLSKECLFTKVSYIGSQVTVDLLPYHLFISSVNNFWNSKKTFAKSSGTCAIKLKAKKTVKLTLVKLPSTITYFFLKNTKCLLGKNYNFFNNKFIEGKWGFSLHKTKTIHVRGVAMNPVDHPNGGRTKAKQPEKSPWGWIAKRGK